MKSCHILLLSTLPMVSDSQIMLSNSPQQIQIILMKTALYRGKKSLNNWQQSRKFDTHQQRLKNIRPQSHDFDWQPPTLNQGKRMMQQQDKFTQIQRQNRYLLQKIATTMRKKGDHDPDKERMGKSLHAPFRRRQLQTIQTQNAKLLKRIQDRKSDYNTKKMKQDWKKQKQVIKNITFYPFILKTSFRNNKRRTLSTIKPNSHHEINRSNALNSDIQMVRARNFDGEAFIVTIRLGEDVMKITGERRRTKEKKLIEIPREQAMAFVQQQCEGKIEAMFDRLSFDVKDNVLYLIGNVKESSLALIKEKNQPETDRAAETQTPQIEEEPQRQRGAEEPLPEAAS